MVEARNFSSPYISRLNLGHTQPPLNGYWVYLLVRKRPGHDIDHPFPSGSEVKNEQTAA
jgi:hypothetical protein